VGVRSRAAINALFVLGLALLVWAFVRTRQDREIAGTQIGASIDERPAPLTKPPAIKVEKRLLVVSNEFHWSQVESDDYKTYIARLRAIGVPEQTIRDIIIADLDKLMAPSVATLRGRKGEIKYWEPVEEELLIDVDAREVARKEREVERQKQEILKELTGADLRRERLQQQGHDDYYERRLSFLPEDRRSTVRDILEKYDDAETQLRARETEEGEPLTLAEQQQARVLRQQRDAELKAALTPAEREQYELWMSTTANAVRSAFYGMNPTESEFRAVYQARKTFDETWGNTDPALLNPSAQQQRAQALQQSEEQIRRALGDQRYAEWKRGEDPDYHQLCALATRYQVPRAKAAEVFSYKSVLQDYRAQVVTDASLTPAQKQQALAAMTQEAEKAIQSALGERAFRQYQRTGQADWIRGEP
jgi:hypothetical protein